LHFRPTFLLMPFTADTLNEKLRRYLPLQNGIV
jgi:hypothetical protein